MLESGRKSFSSAKPVLRYVGAYEIDSLQSWQPSRALELFARLICDQNVLHRAQLKMEAALVHVRPRMEEVTHNL